MTSMFPKITHCCCFRGGRAYQSKFIRTYLVLICDISMTFLLTGPLVTLPVVGEQSNKPVSDHKAGGGERQGPVVEEVQHPEEESGLEY